MRCFFLLQHTTTRTRCEAYRIKTVTSAVYAGWRIKNETDMSCTLHVDQAIEQFRKRPLPWRAAMHVKQHVQVFNWMHWSTLTVRRSRNCPTRRSIHEARAFRFYVRHTVDQRHKLVSDFLLIDNNNNHHHAYGRFLKYWVILRTGRGDECTKACIQILLL